MTIPQVSKVKNVANADLVREKYHSKTDCFLNTCTWSKAPHELKGQLF